MLRPVILAGALGLILSVTAACWDDGEKGDGDRDAPGDLPGGFELASSEKAEIQQHSFVVGMDTETIAAAAEIIDIQFVDVRTLEEFQTGHIPGAKHIPLDGFDPAKLDLTDKLNLVFYCRSGRRSAIAAERLGKHLDDDVMHLEGGIIGWQDAGKDVVIPD